MARKPTKKAATKRTLRPKKEAAPALLPPQEASPAIVPSSSANEPTQPVPAAAGPPPQLSKGVDRWRRQADSKMRRRVAKILTLKLAGYKGPAIAKKLGISEDNVRHYMYIAGKNGWLNATGTALSDPAEELAYNTSHKVVRNVNLALDGVALPPTMQEMTIEAAKGLGYFKNHSAIKNEGPPQQNVLVVQFEMPRGEHPDPPKEALPMGGTPMNYLEAAIVDDPEGKK